MLPFCASPELCVGNTGGSGCWGSWSSVKNTCSLCTCPRDCAEAGVSPARAGEECVWSGLRLRHSSPASLPTAGSPPCSVLPTLLLLLPARNWAECCSARPVRFQARSLLPLQWPCCAARGLPALPHPTPSGSAGRPLSQGIPFSLRTSPLTASPSSHFPTGGSSGLGGNGSLDTPGGERQPAGLGAGPTGATGVGEAF